MHSIAEESFSDAQPGIESLARMHWDEIETTSFPFDIDWALLQTLADAGALITVTVRDDQDVFVGYALYSISPMTHSAGVRVAISDSLYLRPDHRKGALGIRFLRESERILRDAGVDMIVQNVRTSSVKLAGVLERLNYDRDGFTYIKEVA